MQEPVVRKAALELGCDGASAVVEGTQNADDKFGALRIVQSELANLLVMVSQNQFEVYKLWTTGFAPRSRQSIGHE